MTGSFAPFPAVPVFLASRHAVVRTLSSASVAQETMWKPSRMRSAMGHQRNMYSSIHRAPSPAATRMDSRRAGVNAWKNRSNTFCPRPWCIQMTRPRSWSTTTVMYVWPFL